MVSSTLTAKADNLATLALMAATELDKIEHGSIGNVERVSTFLKAMASTSGGEHEGGDTPLWLDPDMFSSAVAQISTRPINIDQLRDELFDNLKQWSESEPKQIASELKKFCLAIHEYVIRHRSRSALNERGVFDYDYSYTR